MSGLGQQIKVQSLSDVKLEVIETEPLQVGIKDICHLNICIIVAQVYFTSNGVSRARTEAGEIQFVICSV